MTVAVRCNTLPSCRAFEWVSLMAGEMYVRLNSGCWVFALSGRLHSGGIEGFSLIVLAVLVMGSTKLEILEG